MKRVYLDFLYAYPKKEVYFLAYIFGRRLVDFLGDDGFCFFLDSKVLLFSNDPKEIWGIRDKTYKLHSGSKGLEYFLKKLIKGQSLKRNENEEIPNTFDNSNPNLRKIKDRKLILKTKSTWEFCRNEIMHPSTKNYTHGDVLDKYGEITELVAELYKDFYGKSIPDQEIKDGYDMYFTNRNSNLRKKSLLFKLLKLK